MGEEAERIAKELTREAEELRRARAEFESQALRSRAERDRFARDVEEIALERDRLLSETSRKRLELTKSCDENKQLRKELVELGLMREAFESQIQKQKQENEEASSAALKMERKYQQCRRQVQSLRGLACPECRMRAAEMDSVEDFFEEVPKQRVGHSCYGRPLPQLPPGQSHWQAR